MIIHKIKVSEKYFKEVVDGNKLFEVVKENKKYQIGDILKFEEYHDEKQEFTENYVLAQVTCIFGREEQEKSFIAKGYLILGYKLNIVIGDALGGKQR